MNCKHRQGHLLVGIETREGVRTHIVPATFTDNGLAMHRELFTDGWTVTHVRSGLKLRGMLKQREARKLLNGLANQDWTFPESTVSIKHSEIIREALGEI